MRRHPGAGQGLEVKNRVLIVSDEFDPHADQMVVLLQDLGVACSRWIANRFPLDATVSVRADSAGARSEVKDGALQIDFENVRSVWYRHPGPPRQPPGLSGEESRFAAAEVRTLLAGLYQLADCFWVNHPEQIRVAENKPLQLKLAAQLGFRVPRTLVSNDPQAVREFSAANRDGTIYKPLNSGFLLSRDRLCYTRVLSDSDLDRIELVRNAPGIFQEHLRKKFDLRVTLIGEHVFATEIHSQELPHAKSDWRAASVEDLPHHPHRLPAELEQRCKAFLRRLGLVYGAMDLVVEPDGGYVFLENNPSGQFGWIEGKTGAPLTATLAKMLIAGKQV